MQKKSTLSNLLPTADELRYLAHTRHASDTEAGASIGNESALVIANRLPQPQGTSIIHLVSVENRYQADKTFDFNEAADSDLITLVSLKSWRIACVTPEQSFEKLLHNLDKGTTALPAPPNIQATGKAFMEMGFVPIPHFFRRGGKSISWYHGPLAPGDHKKRLDTSIFPVHTSDELLRYDTEHGLFDVSYAAAWELGRLLCLKQKSISLKLYQWKRQHATQLKQAEQRLAHPHLPLSIAHHHDPGVNDLPAEVDTWFRKISLLEGIPFNYLLPDERLLPKESIRFFQLDASWIASLIDGAFSIGRVIRQDKAQDLSLKGRLGDMAAGQGQVSGFIMRSAVVSGWPGLLVEGYDSKPDKANENKPIDKEPLKILQTLRLAPQILLYLFDGDLQVLDIHLKPETLHFGVDETPNSTPLGYEKKMRNSNGTELPDDKTIAVQLKLNTHRKVDINSLFKDMTVQSSNKQELGFKQFTAAQFALEMIEGVPKVRFMRG